MKFFGCVTVYISHAAIAGHSLTYASGFPRVFLALDALTAQTVEMSTTLTFPIQTRRSEHPINEVA